VRGEEETRGESAGELTRAGIGHEHQQKWWAPARDSAGLAASRVGGRKGDGGGGHGLLIGVGVGKKRPGINRD
jgi:hypothetical protein